MSHIEDGLVKRLRDDLHSLPKEHRVVFVKILDKIQERAAKGFAKYGIGVDREDLSPTDWLNHALEEALDLSVYIERICHDERLPSDIRESIAHLQNDSLTTAIMMQYYVDIVEGNNNEITK